MGTEKTIAVSELIDTRVEADRLIVVYKAEGLIFSNAKMIFDYLADIIGSDRSAVLDIRTVKNLDSTGCGGLLRLNRQLENVGGKLGIICNPHVFEMLTRISMHRLMPIYKSLDELDFDIAQE